MPAFTERNLEALHPLRPAAFWALLHASTERGSPLQALNLCRRANSDLQQEPAASLAGSNYWLSRMGYAAALLPVRHLALLQCRRRFLQHHQNRHQGFRSRSSSGRVSSKACELTGLPTRRRTSTSKACAIPRASFRPCIARRRHS